MEELIVYGIFADLNLKSENLYQEKLDALFLENPDNKHLLELELLSGNISESIIYITNHAVFSKINTKLYRKYLSEYLERLYYEINIKIFSELCYKIWFRLPVDTATSKYFLRLNYAHDYVSTGDIKQAVENFEEMFSYYKSGRFLNA